MSLKKHWLKTGVTLLVSLLENPKRIAALWRALAVLGSRRSEQGILGHNPMGEVVCIAAKSAYLKSEFRMPGGSRPSDALVVYAAQRLHELGVDEMRMLVDTDNKPVLFLYRALGARFESYEQGGEPQVQVWFDVGNLAGSRPGPWG